MKDSSLLMIYPDDNTDDGNNGGKDSSCNNVGKCDTSTKKCTCDMEFKGVDCTKLGEISI